MSPKPTAEMVKQDAAIAWQRWAKGAPLDLLDYFEKSELKLEDVGIGPELRTQLNARAHTMKDGSIKVELHFTRDEEPEDAE